MFFKLGDNIDLKNKKQPDILPAKLVNLGIENFNSGQASYGNHRPIWRTKGEELAFIRF